MRLTDCENFFLHFLFVYLNDLLICQETKRAAFQITYV